MPGDWCSARGQKASRAKDEERSACQGAATVEVQSSDENAQGKKQVATRHNETRHVGLVKSLTLANVETMIKIAEPRCGGGRAGEAKPCVG
jgi:hypothetical protein